jgi:hypothetical protein
MSDERGSAMPARPLLSGRKISFGDGASQTKGSDARTAQMDMDTEDYQQLAMQTLRMIHDAGASKEQATAVLCLAIGWLFATHPTPRKAAKKVRRIIDEVGKMQSQSSQYSS